jgi:hypothetical protein
MRDEVLAPTMVCMQMEESSASISLSQPRNTRSLPRNGALQRSQAQQLVLEQFPEAPLLD